jgi:hypothetical protein
MQPVKLTVRCIAWPERGQWIAACIDLTLAAQASSCEEARHKLHAQIADYVSEALTIDQDHAEMLLSRRAPLRDRLRYTFWEAMKHRPRLRRTLRVLVDRIGLALSRKLAYSELLPLRPA